VMSCSKVSLEEDQGEEVSRKGREGRKRCLHTSPLIHWESSWRVE
jgi:hypothetical protein